MAREDATLVIGIGNFDRGDDAIGRMVARRLRATAKTEAEILEHDGEMTGLLALLEHARAVVIVDASASGAPAGTLHRFEVGAAPLPADRFRVSTHGHGLAAALELARALGQLPRRCVVYAVEGQSFVPGAGLSPSVADALDAVVAEIRRELASRGDEQLTR